MEMSISKPAYFPHYETRVFPLYTFVLHQVSHCWQSQIVGKPWSRTFADSGSEETAQYVYRLRVAWLLRYQYKSWAFAFHSWWHPTSSVWTFHKVWSSFGKLLFGDPTQLRAVFLNLLSLVVSFPLIPLPNEPVLAGYWWILCYLLKWCCCDDHLCTALSEWGQRFPRMRLKWRCKFW